MRSNPRILDRYHLRMPAEDIRMKGFRERSTVDEALVAALDGVGALAANLNVQI